MVSKWWRRLHSLVNRTRVEKDMARELDFHISMEMERHMREGKTREQARRLALIALGGVEQTKEGIREARGLAHWEALVQDVRYGLRTLAKNPAYTAVAILTLALGIGANSAIFSVIDAVLLEPLPYRDGNRLVLLRQSAPLAGQDNIGVSIREVLDYREQLCTFEDVVEYHSMSFTLLNRGEPDRVLTGVVSANFFDVLGVQPYLGRTFIDGDDDLGAEAVLILSYPYWQGRFGGDTNIVGQVFEMNDRPHTVVGVLPPIPQYPRENDVYMPTSACPFRAAGERAMDQNRRAFSILSAWGRIKPDVTPEQVARDVETVASRFRQEYPEVYRADAGLEATPISLFEELTSEARPMLLLLMGTTILVLIIACANVANLTLARMMRRERELAMRATLGAGRGRLIRQLLTESALVAMAGGVLGLVVAASTIDLLRVFVSRFTPRTEQIGIDGGVLVFTLAVAVLTGLVFGAMAALPTRVHLVDSLGEGGTHAGASRGRHRLRKLLIVAQVTVSFVLLIGAGLLLSSFYRLARVDAGFEAERVVSAEIFGNFTKYQDADDLLGLYIPLIERLQANPVVLSAAVTNAVPLSNIRPFDRPFLIEGVAQEDPSRRPVADGNIASVDYFTTLGIRLLRGRTFTSLDHAESPRVAVINQSMARAWGKSDPVGSRFSVDDGETWLTVVGVVGDVLQYGLDRKAIAQFYTPLRQTRNGLGGRLLVRANAEPMDLAALIKRTVWAIDPEQAVENFQTLEELRSGRLATPRLTASLLVLFAGLALVITVAGIAGVIATTVGQRTQEFGLRMALGASRSAVLNMVLRQGLTLVLMGLTLGIVGALFLSRFVSSYLFATEPTDPVTYVSVSLVFALAGVAACLGPARRAVAIDPVDALRCE